MTDALPLLAAYDIATDPVIAALIEEAAADPEVIGLVLTGSRAIGAVTSESDYDGVFVVTDAAYARYEATQQHPLRGATVQPAISTDDLWHEPLAALAPDRVVVWDLPAWAESRVLYDRTGETTAAIDALRRMLPDHAQTAIAASYDGYLNGLYRSLKSWRRGNTLGGRLESAGTVDSLLHLLFALEEHWRPFSSRLPYHLAELAPQGWQPNEVADRLLDLIGTGDPYRQQAFAQRVIALLRERGFHHVYESWNGQIDQALAWPFPTHSGEEVVSYG
ncbi:MAG: hypothetical protein H7Y32_06335 [Chloroflexales bacterium]|nr:hypothetical protein [Chloroflexales bacterium]